MASYVPCTVLEARDRAVNKIGKKKSYSHRAYVIVGRDNEQNIEAN